MQVVAYRDWLEKNTAYQNIYRDYDEAVKVLNKLKSDLIEEYYKEIMKTRDLILDRI